MTSLLRSIDQKIGSSFLTEQQINRIKDDATCIRILAVSKMILGSICFCAGVSFAASVAGFTLSVACVITALALFILAKDALIIADNWESESLKLTGHISSARLLDGTFSAYIPGSHAFIEFLIGD